MTNNALAKLTIFPEKPQEIKQQYPNGIAVQFNPTSYSINQTVTWKEQGSSTENPGGNRRDLNAPPLTYAGGNSRTLTMELVFDVTENGTSADVRDETEKVVQLCRIVRTKDKAAARPPVCRFEWGTTIPDNKYPLKGVVTSCSQNFTLFRGNGVPLRAKLNVTITEYLDPEDDKKKTDPDVTTYIIKRGDTLSSIAFAMYRDPTQWRVIAAANHIEDPRRLVIGSGLSIPNLS
jgi:nucleoid-associated protein YgaU